MHLAPLIDEANRLIAACRAHGTRIVTAESCTGGLISALLTEGAGSSDVLERGFVTYSNAAKEQVLGVPGALLAQHGAVSAEVARAMAAGALARSAATLAVSVTGIAGPGGGSALKPVGLVYLGMASLGQPTTHLECRFGDIGRSAVRLNCVKAALGLLWQALPA
ncbi:MAG TPA: CinA family protein [Hyphomicrobiaceae bacterium]|jgi:nicotinamide-nucleotide amidase|nr:CinA family protein [Hyphomicrobiaceae bacterium]